VIDGVVSANPADLYPPLVYGRYAIWVGESGLLPGVPGSLGTVYIKDNDITVFNSAGTGAEFSSGAIMTVNVIKDDVADHSDIYVENNIVRNPGHAGIVVGGTPGASIVVKENTVEQKPVGWYNFQGERDQNHPLRAGRGIQVFSAPVYGGECALVEVKENILKKISTKGIAVHDISAEAGSEVNVLENVISMNQALDDASGIYVGWLPSDLLGLHRGCQGAVLVKSNTVKGKSTYGIHFTGFSLANLTEGNTIEESTIKSAKEYDIYLDEFTAGNIVKDTAGLNVVDDGNNIITP
jgi:lambda repressor-like predicted transcriptional regulator